MSFRGLFRLGGGGGEGEGGDYYNEKQWQLLYDSPN